MAKSIIGIFTYLRYHILVGNMLKQIYILIYLKRKINTLKWNCCIPDVFLDALKWRGWSKNVIFNLKFLITGFFWAGKFGKYAFGWLDLRRVFFFFFFLHIQNNLKLQSFCVMLLMKQNMFVSVSSVSACDFFFFLWGWFLSRDFLFGFVESPRNLFAFWFLSPAIRSSPSLEILRILLGSWLLHRGYQL